MRFTIVTVGSEGDVRPYIALAAGLGRSGHAVRIATHARFESLVRSRGVDFAPIVGDPQLILDREVGRAWVSSGSNPLAFARGLQRVLEPLKKQALVDIALAGQDADALVVSILAAPAGQLAAAEIDIPCYRAFLAPMTPTRMFPNPFLPLPFRLNLGGAYNLLTHLTVVHSLSRMFGLVNGAPPHPALLYGYSPSLLPRPPDWGKDIHVSGFWFLESERSWQAPRELRAFLDNGLPPVYIGFGSMSSFDPRGMSEIAVQALARVAQRGILLTGWSGLPVGKISDNVYQIDAVPHDWLFPRVAAVVHHGGVGTVASGLRAGVPTVTVPFFADQTFWGWRLFDAGLAAAPIPRNQLTLERLESALRLVLNDPVLRRRAADVGAHIRDEDGVGRAVEILESSC